jgi:hypothetical protein
MLKANVMLHFEILCQIGFGQTMLVLKNKRVCGLFLLLYDKCCDYLSLVVWTVGCRIQSGTGPTAFQSEEKVDMKEGFRSLELTLRRGSSVVSGSHVEDTEQSQV